MFKIMPDKLGNKLAMLYENYFILPQNETLIELKRKEFKEKTKYLDPKVLYTLTDEEKGELRNQGYFVDLSEKTVKDIKEFKLSYNRHLRKYNPAEWYNNFAIQNTKYYYTDQHHHLFWGDPHYFRKMWRNRTRPKFLLFKLVAGYIVLYIYYKYSLKRHINTRKKIKNLAEKDPSILIPVENIP